MQCGQSRVILQTLNHLLELLFGDFLVSVPSLLQDLRAHKSDRNISMDKIDICVGTHLLQDLCADKSDRYQYGRDRHFFCVCTHLLQDLHAQE